MAGCDVGLNCCDLLGRVRVQDTLAAVDPVVHAGGLAAHSSGRDGNVLLTELVPLAHSGPDLQNQTRSDQFPVI